MRLVNKDITSRLIIKLNRSVSSDESSGIMNYGENNDYPQLIEKLILGSQTGKAVANVFAKFIAGSSFSNPEIGKEIVGSDKLGKPVTLDSIRIAIADSVSRFNGAAIHCNLNLNSEVGKTKVIPFKNCRLSKEDDNGFCAKIAFHQNWTKEPGLKTFQVNDIVWFNQFNLTQKVIADQIRKSGGIDKYKGQVYSLYFDDTYLYPLSPFDSVYLDLDTEAQIQIFKNNEIRDGFSDKIIFNIPSSSDEKERGETADKIKSFMGADGDKCLIFESLFDENGGLLKDGSYKIDKVVTNINDTLFSDWEKSTSNNIRKAAFALPAVLIDYESGALSGTSGEAIYQAATYYNSITESYRKRISESIREIYSNSDNILLKNNQDWELLPVEMYKEKATIRSVAR